MTRSLAALLLLVAAATAADAKGAAKCVKWSKKLEKQQAAATDFTQKKFAAALAGKQLHPVAPASFQVDTDWDEPQPAGANVHAPGEAYQDGAHQHFVAGPQIMVPNGQREQPSYEFVADDAGQLYRVERKPTIKSNTTVLVCGCGPAGSGMAPRAAQIIYQVPDGLTYAGTVDIAYDAKTFNVRWTGQQPDGHACSKPP